MIIDRAISRRATFALEPAQLELFVAVVQKNFPELSYEARCADNAKRIFTDLQELLSFRNFKEEAIDQLAIRSPYYPQRFSVEFHNFPGKNVEATLACPHELAIELENALDALLETTEPWYHAIANSRIINSIVILSVGSIVVIIAAGLWINAKTTLQIALGSKWALLKGSVIGLLLGTILTTYFPAGTFCIGEGVKRHQRKEVIRLVVILSFMVSIAASVAAKWLGV